MVPNVRWALACGTRTVRPHLYVAAISVVGCAVPIYRFYIFEKDALIAAPPKIYDLSNDAAALEAARTINGYAVEVWCHTKKIGRLNPAGHPTSEADHWQARGSARKSAVNGPHP